MNSDQSMSVCVRRVERLERWRRSLEKVLADYDRRIVNMERRERE